MRRTLATLLLLAVGLEAQAGNLGTVKTMREAMPGREIERPLNMNKGWLEFGLGYDHKLGVGAWSSDGEVDKFEDAKWNYGTASLHVRYGLTRRAEVWWTVPVHFASLTNDHLGTDTSDYALGDLWWGYRLRLYGDDAPLTSVVFELAGKGPAAQEAPGSYIGGPLNLASFVFTTGTPDLVAGFGAKRQIGPLAITAHVHYKRRMSSVVQYLVDLEQYQFAGRIKPGDQILADVGVMLQLGPLALEASPRFTRRAKTRIGTTSKGLFPTKNLDDVADSDGIALDLRLQALVNLTRGMDVSAMALLPLMGEDLQFFPIEDLQPTYGPTFGGTLELRY